MKESDNSVSAGSNQETCPSQKRTSIVEGIEIQGIDDFINHSEEAIILLVWKSESFRSIKSYLGRIQQGERSTIRVNKDVPTFIVNERTWRHSRIWYAGAIAHDTYHSYLYHTNKVKNNGNEPLPDSWGGSEAENCCLDFQLQVLMELDAPESILNYIRRLKKDPNYRGNPYWSQNGFQDW